MTLRAAIDANDLIKIKKKSSSIFANYEDIIANFFYVCKSPNISVEILNILYENPNWDLINRKNNDGFSPLIVAIMSNNLLAVKFLLSHGANPNSLKASGKSVLNFVITDKTIKENFKIKIIALLIQYKAKINPMDKNGVTPLIHAVKSCNLTITKLLLDNGANVNKQDKFGNTPLIFACKEENIDIATLLLDNGANVNKQDNFGNTPLIFACKEENIDIATLLLDNGAKTFYINEQEESAITIANSSNNELLKNLFQSFINPTLPSNKEEPTQKEQNLTIERTIETEDYNKITEAIKKIITTFDKSILTNSVKFLSVFKDLCPSPSMKVQRNTLGFAIQIGIGDELLKSDTKEHLEKQKTINLLQNELMLDYGFTEERSIFIVKALTDSLNWGI